MTIVLIILSTIQHIKTIPPSLVRQVTKLEAVVSIQASSQGARKAESRETSPNKSKGNFSQNMGYHKLSTDGNYSYDYKATKQGYKRMHGKSVTANTSPISSTNRPGSNKKHMQSLNQSSIGFSHSQHVSPSLSKSNKLYRPKKDKLPASTTYALAQIGKKTYVVPTSGGNSNSEKSNKPSLKGSNCKGNTAYNDAFGY